MKKPAAFIKEILDYILHILVAGAAVRLCDGTKLVNPYLFPSTDD